LFADALLYTYAGSLKKKNNYLEKKRSH